MYSDPKDLSTYNKTLLLTTILAILYYSETLSNRPKSELTRDELKQLEEFEFKHGPMSLITDSMNSKVPVIISLRNNHKIIARVKASFR